MATHQPIGRPLISHRRLLLASPSGQITSPSGQITSVAFSSDGKTLAAGGNAGTDVTVSLWDVTTHQPVGAPLISGQGDPVSSVAFSPHGETLGIGSYDGSVWLRGVAPHRHPGRLINASGFPVYSVAFSANGKTLASGSIDGSVRLWNVATSSHNLAEVADLVHYLCALAGRSLTHAEWARYLPHLPYERVCP